MVMGNQASGGGGGLGEARGSIVIDYRSVEQAAKAVEQLAARMTAVMQNIGKGGGGASAGFQAVAQQAAKAADSMTMDFIDASKTIAQNVQNATKSVAEGINNAVTNARQSLGQLKQEAERVDNVLPFDDFKHRDSGGGGGGGQRNRNQPPGVSSRTTPAFLQFALFPFASLAMGTGATGVGQGLMTAAAVAGVTENLATLRQQLVQTAVNLQQAGGVLGQFATKVGSVFGASGTFGNAIGTLAAVAIPATLAIVAIGAAITDFQKRVQAAEDAVRGAFQRRVAVADMVSSGMTTAEADQEWVRRRESVENQQNELRLLQGFVDRYVEVAGVITWEELLDPQSYGHTIDRINEDLSAATGGAYTDVRSLANVLPELKKNAADAQIDLNELGRAIFNGAFAANDAAAEEAEAASLTSLAAKARIQAEVAATNMTVQSARERQREIAAERSAISRNYQFLTDEEKKLADQRVIALDAERDVIAAGMPQILWRDFVTNFQQGFQQLMEMAANFGLQITRINEDRQIAAAQQFEDYGIRGSREADDFARRRGQQIEDFNRELARFDEDYREQQQEAQEDFHEDQLEREQDYQDRLAKIIADARVTILESAARLDARGVYEAQRRRNQQLAETTKEYEEEKRQREENFREELEDQREQYERQRAERIKDFQRSLAREDQERAIRSQRELDDYNRQIQRQAAAYALQDARRQEDYNLQVQRLLGHNTTMQGIIGTGLNVVELLYRSHMTNLAGIAGGGTSPAPTSPNRYTTSPGSIFGGTSTSGASDGSSAYVDLRGATISGFSTEAFERHIRAFFEQGASQLEGRAG